MESVRRPPELPVSDRKVKEKVYPRLSLKEILTIIGGQCAPVGIETYGKGLHKVVILPEAWEELRHMIYYGKRHPVNIYEQQYQGMGHIFIDDNGVITVVISHFLYIYSACRGSTVAYVAKDKYDSMMERLEQEREIYKEFEVKYNQTVDGYKYDPFVEFGPSEVVFYGHTHPGIGVFFSPDDRKSGYATKTLPAVTYVCDPIKKDMKAVVGLAQEDAQILVCHYSRKNMANKTRKVDCIREDKKRQDEKNVSIEKLVSSLGVQCNEVLAKDGAKGKYESYYSRNGQLCVSFNVKCKLNGTKKVTESKNVVGNAYDSYA